MKIGINCLNMDPGYVGGVNTFAKGLIEGLAASSNGHEMSIFVQDKHKHALAKLFPAKAVLDPVRVPLLLKITNACSCNLGSASVTQSLNTLFSRNIARRFSATADILLSPVTFLSVYDVGVPQCVSMHDIQHVHFPRFFSRTQLRKRRVLYGLTARNADYLQASSLFIRGDFLEHFPFLSPKQITVIPEGVNVEQFASPADTQTIRKKYRLPDDYLFYPAQLWPHKNHITVLQALSRVRKYHGVTIPLVLTGAQNAAAPEIFAYIAGDTGCDVRYLGVVPFDDIPGIYHSSTAVVQAGLHESSSLPVLEACAAGKPVIAARIPPNEETAGRLRIDLFSPEDDIDLAEKLYRLWTDPQRKQDMAAHNRTAVHGFDWAVIAKQYIRFFEKVLGCRRNNHRKDTEVTEKT